MDTPETGFAASISEQSELQRSGAALQALIGCRGRLFNCNVSMLLNSLLMLEFPP